MQKIVNEEDFLYAKEESFRQTEVNGNSYYYMINPYNGRKIYAKDKAELKSKVLTQTEFIRSLLSDDTMLIEAIMIWDRYVRYAPDKEKNKFQEQVKVLAERIERDNSESAFNKRYYDCSVKELSDIISCLETSNIKVRDDFIRSMSEFLVFMKWSGIHVDYKEFRKNNKTSQQLSREEKIKGYKDAPSITKVIYLSDIESIDKMLQEAVIGNKEINFRHLAILVSLHTGMFVGDVFKLKWGDVDFENMTIGECRCEMDNVVSSTLAKYLAQNYPKRKHIEKELLFPPTDNKTLVDHWQYSMIYGVFRNLLNKAWITSDISLRDLSLVKGKIMLDNKVNPDRVAEILNITRRSVFWARMNNLILVNERESKETKDSNELKELNEVLKDFPEDKLKDLIKYARFLKES